MAGIKTKFKFILQFQHSPDDLSLFRPSDESNESVPHSPVSFSSVSMTDIVRTHEFNLMLSDFFLKHLKVGSFVIILVST